MTLRTYLALMRLWLLWLFVPLMLAGGAIFHKLAPFGEHRIGAEGFITLILLGPIVLSYLLSQAVKAPMHEPFGITLPNLRRNLLKWHLPLLAMLALFLAMLCRGHDRSLPLPVAASVAFSGLCLMLPYEPVGRWFGSHVLAGLIASLYFVAAIFAQETRAAMQYAPWLTFALSLGIAAQCCRLGFARRRLYFRVRNRRRPFEFGALFDPNAAQKREQLALARSKRIGLNWTLRSVGNSTADWLRVVLHETYGATGGWARRFAVLSLIYLTTTFALWYFLHTRTPATGSPRVPFPQLVYQIVWEPHLFGAGRDGALSLVVLMPFYMAAGIIALPRPQHLYPLSRERRARLTFVASLLQAGGQVLICLFGIVTLSWIGALVAGVPFRPTVAPDFVVVSLALAPLLPAMFWMKLRMQVRPWERQLFALFFPACIVMMNKFVVWVPADRAWLLSPIGLAIALTAFAASLLLYRAALFKFYRRGDLLQRQKSGANFRLV